jgi:predicted anti-sigma-YlaC factor YlaD
MLTKISDPDRQAGLVWLILAVFGALMAVFAWIDYARGLGLFR